MHEVDGKVKQRQWLACLTCQTQQSTNEICPRMDARGALDGLGAKDATKGRDTYFKVPLVDRQRVCDSKPVSMNLEICGFTAGRRVRAAVTTTVDAGTRLTMRETAGPSALSQPQRSGRASGTRAGRTWFQTASGDEWLRTPIMTIHISVVGSAAGVGVRETTSFNEADVRHGPPSSPEAPSSLQLALLQPAFSHAASSEQSPLYVGHNKKKSAVALSAGASRADEVARPTAVSSSW